MKKKNIFLLIALLAISLCLPFALNACKNETLCLHEWKTESVLRNATCTEVGSESQICVHCNQTRTAEIPALGHDLKTVAKKNATCTEVGCEAYEQCARCDYHTQIAEVSALGHSFAEAYSVHENTHYQVCTREGCTAKQNEATHSGTPVCGEQTVCSTCQTAYGSVTEHVWAWNSNQNTHYEACTRPNCSATQTHGTHLFSAGICSVCERHDTFGSEGLTILYNETDPHKAPLSVYYVSAYQGSDTSVTVPYYYDDGVHGLQPVVAIAPDAFKNCTAVTDITLPDCILSIGLNAFSDTAWWESQPDGAVYIGKVLYQYKGTVSPSDADFVVKSDTVAIAAWAFNSQHSLKSVTLPNSVVQIGGYAFYNCMGLERVTLGSNVKIIGGAAFGWCEKLTSLVLPSSVQVIGQEAIGHCKLLTSVTFDGTLAELKEATTQTLFWYSKTNRELVITCTDGTFTPYHAPQAATADEDGNVEYWEDLKTGKKYSDDAYTQEISDVTVPAVGS